MFFPLHFSVSLPSMEKRRKKASGLFSRFMRQLSKSVAQSIDVPLSGEEVQLLDYEATRSNSAKTSHVHGALLHTESNEVTTGIMDALETRQMLLMASVDMGGDDDEFHGKINAMLLEKLRSAAWKGMCAYLRAGFHQCVLIYIARGIFDSFTLQLHSFSLFSYGSVEIHVLIPNCLAPLILL